MMKKFHFESFFSRQQNERQSIDEVKIEPITVDQSQQTTDAIEEKEEVIQLSSCFANGNDRWSQQLDPFQSTKKNEKNKRKLR